MILSYSDRRLGAAEIFVHLAQSWNVSFGLLLTFSIRRKESLATKQFFA